MQSIDIYLNRVPKQNYNCLDFVNEVWLGLFGGNVKERLDCLSSSIHATQGKILFAPVKGFTKLSKPESPCFVVMQRKKLTPHIGIYYNGRMLHLRDNGVEYQPLQVAKRYFTKIGFYK
jgi:hypothetical protein